MNYINPDNEDELINFYREWKSNYPDVTRTGKNKVKETRLGLKPPSITTMRILYAYATQGDIPGESLVAILQNSLYDAFNTASQEEVDLIPSTLQYVTMYLPGESFGNSEKYGKWINKMRKTKSGRPTDFY